MSKVKMSKTDRNKIVNSNVIKCHTYEDFDIVSDAAQKVTNVALSVVLNEVTDSYVDGFVSLAFPWSRTAGSCLNWKSENCQTGVNVQALGWVGGGTVPTPQCPIAGDVSGDEAVQ